MKFLIDECLSPELAEMAHAAGHGESSHVVWMGHSGIKDWETELQIAADAESRLWEIGDIVKAIEGGTRE